MKEVDFIIVGGGLAGLTFAETLLQNNKSFVLFSDNAWRSSRVAAGLYNPLIIKRYKPLQDALEQIQFLRKFYTTAEERLSSRFHYEKRTLRKFTSIAEQNEWFEYADKPQLQQLLSSNLYTQSMSGIDSPYQFGVVNFTGFLDTVSFIDRFHEFLLEFDCFRNDSFDYSSLEIEDGGISYPNIKAKHIVFAEGYAVSSNPFFDFVNVPGTKGEGITIEAPELDLSEIINSGVFILPLGNHRFKVGATYEWTDKTEETTNEAREELIERLKQVITCNFTVIDQWAGVRPTTPDRKAIVGTHPKFQQLHILNGLGTRGVMLGPSMSKLLYESIYDLVTIPQALNVDRFLNLKP